MLSGKKNIFLLLFAFSGKAQIIQDKERVISFTDFIEEKYSLNNCYNIDTIRIEKYSDTSEIYYCFFSVGDIEKRFDFIVSKNDTLCSFHDAILLNLLKEKKNDFNKNDYSLTQIKNLLKNVNGIKIVKSNKTKYIEYKDKLLNSRNEFVVNLALCKMQGEGFISDEISKELVSIQTPIDKLYNRYTDSYEIYIQLYSYYGIRYHSDFLQFRVLYFDYKDLVLVFDEIRSRFEKNVIKH